MNSYEIPHLGRRAKALYIPQDTGCLRQWFPRNLGYFTTKKAACQFPFLFGDRKIYEEKLRFFLKNYEYDLTS